MRKAPYKDFIGSDIFEGDDIIHPDGNSGKVAFFGSRAHRHNRWKVIYDDGTMKRLSVQVGDNERGLVRSK